MTCLLGHDGTRGRNIEGQITKFLRCTMAAANLSALKSIVAFIGDPVLAGVTITSCKLAILGHHKAVQRVSMQLTRTLFDYDHEGSSFL